MKRSPRFKRLAEYDEGFRRQERDERIIRLVAEFRYIESDDIAKLLNCSQDVANRRLRKLWKQEYLDRPIKQRYLVEPPAGSHKMVYSLGPDGARFLDISRRNSEVKQYHLEHSLMISKFRTALTVALDKHPQYELVHWQNESKTDLTDRVMATEQGKRIGYPIAPDGYFILKDKNTEEKMHFFLEAENSRKSKINIHRKYRGYWLWYREKGCFKKFGITGFRVLTITNDEKRLTNLMEIAGDADDKRIGSPMYWFTVMSSLDQILKEIWWTLADNKLHSLLE
jgi:hypothetical protein